MVANLGTRSARDPSGRAAAEVSSYQQGIELAAAESAATKPSPEGREKPPRDPGEDFWACGPPVVPLQEEPGSRPE